MMECGELCTADLACVSFNLNKTGSDDGFQCSLLGEIWEDGELLPDNNTQFYGKLVVTEMSWYIRIKYKHIVKLYIHAGVKNSMD